MCQLAGRLVPSTHARKYGGPMKPRNRLYLLAGCILVPVILFAGCGIKEIQSKWCDRTIEIDGIDNGTEWENARNYFEKEKVTIGVMNDDKTLFLRLSTRDRQIQRQLLSMGFTIWFDENCDKEKTLGIHFPLGMQWAGKPVMPTNSRNSRASDSTMVNSMLTSVQTELELIEPGDSERNKIAIANALQFGINCRIGNTGGNLVYELQFPLHRTFDCPYGILTKSANAIRIGLEAGKMDLSQMKQGSGSRGDMGGGPGGGTGGGMGGGPGGGMGGGMGGGPGGGMGGGRGGGQGGPGGQQSTESFEMWIQATLAVNGNVKF